MITDEDYFDQQEPPDADGLGDEAVDVTASIAARLGKFEWQLAVFRHHNRGNAAALELARKLASDVHADVCATLRQFGRRS